MAVTIKDAQTIDMELVHRIMRQAFEEYAGKLTPESGALKETVDDIIAKTSNRGGAILAYQDPDAVGSAQFYYQDTYMYIGRVSVIPECRGMGIGGKMLKYLENKAIERHYAETRVEVRLSIPENVKYYLDRGYSIIQEQEYSEKTDRWYVMRKRLMKHDHTL
ncbi:GNAT family N-acetyltransferase [Paenibacillus silviterrae]|uniref:GNAT family N-acetyltransferase n=1 Tax=Paenibacillus silviterrae TaxID=3242194 RepID=UPI002542A6A3|nr:GNAT family N-acetyltransferase [Paenibacillus chinjuensis]